MFFNDNFFNKFFLIGIIDLVDVEGYVFERLREENVFPIEVDFLCFYYFLGLYEMLL